MCTTPNVYCTIVQKLAIFSCLLCMEHNKCKKSAVEYFPDNRVDISLNNDDALNETMEKELDNTHANTHGYSRAHLTLRAVDVVLLTF